MRAPLSLASRLTIVGGKGGVGKTTTAAALAVSLAEQGEEILIVSVDPAHSLGDALGIALGPDPVAVPDVPGLSAMEVDADAERQRFLDSHRGALLSLLERGTYLDGDDTEGFLDLTVPGLDELAALFRLPTLLAPGKPHVILDTAPTGHTLRLLDLPSIARGWLGALQAMEEKHRLVSNALVGAYAPDDAQRLLAEIDDDLAELEALLTDPERTRFLLVTGREPVVLAETLRYQEELARRRIAIAAVVVNRSLAGDPPAQGDVPMIFVPPLAPEPVGIDGLRSFARFFSAGSSREPAEPPPAAPGRIVVGPPFAPPHDRALYLVGGKGGVGKSTLAAALAVDAAARGRRVLLLSVDPAGSIADVLDQGVGAHARPVDDVPRLWARQMDARGEWEEFRSRYRAEAERIFGTLLSGGLSATPDRDVVARLVDLAPPGMDELVALMEVVDVTEDRLYDAIVLDSAPTGHFLRLLELPEVALEWTHQVMRMLLKYREVMRPGELAGRLLRLAQSLHQFMETVQDPAATWTLVVALPEALAVPESRRLLQRLGELHVQPGALLINRLLHDDAVPDALAAAAAQLAHAAAGLPIAAAPTVPENPRGPAALAELAGSWRTLILQDH